MAEVTARDGPGDAVVVGATVVDEPSAGTVVVVEADGSGSPGMHPCTGRR